EIAAELVRWNNNEALSQVFCLGLDVNRPLERYSGASTLLGEACEEDAADIVELLIEEKADVNQIAHPNGKRPLALATPVVARLLLEAKADETLLEAEQ